MSDYIHETVFLYYPKQKRYENSIIHKFWNDLNLDLLIGQGRRFHTKLSELSSTYGKKVVRVFPELKKLSGAIATRRGLGQFRHE